MADTKKIALITGANRGLGLETARQLGKAGVAVVVGARDLSKAEAAVATLKGEGVEAYPLKLDVTDAADRAAAVEVIEEKFGRLDILVNNAGVKVGEEWMGNSTSSMTEENLLATFNTNFLSVVALTNALLPLIRKSDAGRIVNVSSILGSLTLHADRTSVVARTKAFAYDASKSALNAFTIHLADELRRTKIKVNSAHPGWVKTEIGTAAAPMEVEEGAKTQVELALAGEDGKTGTFTHMGETLPW